MPLPGSTTLQEDALAAPALAVVMPGLQATHTCASASSKARCVLR
jgi:hypothetical protein